MRFKALFEPGPLADCLRGFFRPSSPVSFVLL